MSANICTSSGECQRVCLRYYCCVKMHDIP